MADAVTDNDAAFRDMPKTAGLQQYVIVIRDTDTQDIRGSPALPILPDIRCAS